MPALTSSHTLRALRVALLTVTLAAACSDGGAGPAEPSPHPSPAPTPGPTPSPTPGPTPGPAPAPQPGSEAGVVTGVARDARGQPIANALVEVKMVFNPNVVRTRTSADGRYTVRGLPVGLSHQVKAWAEVAYHDRAYCVRLGMPNESDYDAFVPATTVVRDFRWQLTGRIPDAPANVFGAGIDVDTWDVVGIQTGDEIEVRLTPQGPLVDGSEGSELTRVVRFGSNLAIHDVPQGVYTAAATLVRNGARTPLQVARAGFGGVPGPTTTVEWEPEIAGAACGQSLGPALKRFPLKVSNR